MKTYRYYCLYRPPMPGTIPRGAIAIKDFGDKQRVEEIGRDAWGYAEFQRELTDHEVLDFELAKPVQ